MNPALKWRKAPKMKHEYSQGAAEALSWAFRLVEENDNREVIKKEIEKALRKVCFNFAIRFEEKLKLMPSS